VSFIFDKRGVNCTINNYPFKYSDDKKSSAGKAGLTPATHLSISFSLEYNYVTGPAKIELVGKQNLTTFPKFLLP